MAPSSLFSLRKKLQLSPALQFLPRSLTTPIKASVSKPGRKKQLARIAQPTRQGDTVREGENDGGLGMEFWNSFGPLPEEPRPALDLDDAIPPVPAVTLETVEAQIIAQVTQITQVVQDAQDARDVGTPQVATEESIDDYATVESYDDYKHYLTDHFEKMMFVSGETAEPSTETTWLIEEIVREQVIHMLKYAVDLANRRGSRSINIHDLMFQIRHDKSKLSRLKTFLSWKDVRKNVKDSDDKGGGGDAGDIDIDADGAQAPAAGGPAPKTNKKQKLVLPWDVESFYAVQVPERDDEEDEEEDEQNEATLARLASADERTKHMTREEYVYWSDCRQASFTFRKGKRFREWAGFGTIVDTKPNDDVIDILGFLTFEIVQTLTETALRVKSEEDHHNRRITQGQGENNKRKREGTGLFEMHEEGKTPIEPNHVREGFRRLQIPPKKYTFMQVGMAGMRRPYQLI